MSEQGDSGSLASVYKLPEPEAVRELIGSTAPKNADFHSLAAVLRVRYTADPASDWNFLAQVLDFHFRPDKAGQPFEPVLVTGEGRSMIPADLTPEQLDWLAELNGVENTDLQSRIMDVLWLRRRDPVAGRAAVQSYLASGIALDDPEHWPPAMQRYERALRLARQIEPKGDLPRSILRHLEKRVLDIDGNDPLYFTAKATALLIEFKFGDSIALARSAGKVAEAAKRSGDSERERTYLLLQARLSRRSGDHVQAEDILCMHAETFIKDAEQREEAGSYIAAHHFWQGALKAFQQRPALKSRVPELRTRLAEAGRRTRAEMQTASTGPIDVSAQIADIEKLFVGLTIDDAFFQFAILTPLIEPSAIREQALDRVRQFPLTSLFKADVFDQIGRKIAVRPAMGSGDPEKEELAVQGFMDEQARLHRHLYAHAILEPAMRIIRDEHILDQAAIESFICDSEFIPARHTSLFVKGLKHGFELDFSTALHILVPQVENGLRHLLEVSGVTPRNLDSDGVEDVWLLGKVLDHPSMAEILGDEFGYELRTLMSGRIGPNLRNLIAHGLVDEGTLNGQIGFYLWCVIMRLVVTPTSGMKAFIERRQLNNEAL